MTTASVKPIPEGFHSLTPYPEVKSAAGLVDFPKQAFGATELLRTTGSMRGMHAEVRIGDSIVMLGRYEGIPSKMPAAIYLYVNDVDAVYRRAIQSDATSMQKPKDQPYGDRNVHAKDPFGNVWYIATHIRDMPM